MTQRILFIFCLVICVGVAIVLAQQPAAKKQPEHTGEETGFTDTPREPYGKWLVHDINRPRPRVITPSVTPGAPPSDAIVLFDGKDLSHWEGRDRKSGQPTAPGWTVENGYMEVAPHTSDLFSKEKFGDAQYHVEWASPSVIRGSSQNRGNSGFIIMSHYEIQVLNSYENVTYADGQAGAIYGQWPPLVNPARKPGEWQTYDIAFEAPKFEDGKMAKPGYVTVFYNGVLVHHHKQILGEVTYRGIATYTAHGTEEPLELQNHGAPVRFRNIWVRKLRPYDEP